MKLEKTYRKLRGINRLEEICQILKVKPGSALNIISKLRKAGYVRTKYAHDRKRVYYIFAGNRERGTNYLDIINKRAPIGIISPSYRVHGRKLTLEETLIIAIKSQSIRVIIGSLALFKQIHNWKLLAKLAKENNLQRQVCALYDIARKIIKTRKMSKNFRKISEPSEKDPYVYMKKGFESKHFINIQKKWKVYIPLNWGDLEEYQYDKYRRTRKSAA